MATRKNQHFVPQMYLRLFAAEGGKHIRVLPLSTGHVVDQASVRDQAAKPWFYDRDGAVEASLARFEGAAAPIIADLLRRDRPPIRGSAEHQGLALFLAIQLTRTQAAADDANERADKVAKALLRQMLEGDERASSIDLVTVRLTHPVADAMRSGFIGSPLLYDLRMKLLRNDSCTPFVASDAPVVLHNRWYEQTGAPATGLASAGLQIVVPLGPRRALLLYDGDVYDVGSPASSSVHLVNPAHVDLINELQWEAARSVMFLPPDAAAEGALAAWERWRPREQNRIKVEHVELSRDANTIRTRLGVASLPSRVQLDLPFVRTKGRPPPAWNDASRALIRHPEWADYVTSLGREVDQGKLLPADFIRRTLKIPQTRRRSARSA